ncbi:peptidase M23, partial [Corynebacterium diphtheriae]
DVETEAGLHVDHIRQCKRLFEAAGVPVIGAYSYVPYWEGRISPHEPDSHEFGAFWVAAYGTNPVGSPANTYPGDAHKQWAYPLGNQKPALWQFGSQAVVAGHKVDTNAFRGSVDQLCELFKIKKKLGKDSAAMEKMLKEIWEQLRGADGKGWAQLGQNAKGQNLTLVDAVAALRQETAEIRRDLEALKAGK